MKTNPIDKTLEAPTDAALVVDVLGGSREAFGIIVERYQRLLCSLAYARLGSLSDSEDVAQETFVEGWRKLSTLKEPDKLKSWLCGILRFKVSHRKRSESRRPSGYSENLEEAGELVSEEEAVEEFTMRGEEQELLWTALEKIPEVYREPLVLYYREHRSVEHVAYELDLSESAVKQRLSRGRNMLKERMMSFVEESLSRSTPGRVFTAGVLAALPVMAAPPAKAAAGAVVAAKVGGWAKWASIIAALGTFSGVISSIFALRAGFDQSRTERERRNVVRCVVGYFAVAIIFVVGLLSLQWLAVRSYELSGYYAVGAQLIVLGLLVSYSWMTVRMLKHSRILRAEERLAHPEKFLDERDQKGSKTREYQSAWKLFGVPLVHVRFAAAEEGDVPVFGWIAAGEKAYGLLFAWGGVAIAPVSVGILSVGVLSVGAVGFGILSLGTVAVGVVAFGAGAIGWSAYSSLSSLGWESALAGGFAVAREGALGKIAFAAEVNNEAAAELTRFGEFQASYVAVLGLIAVLVIVPVAWYAKAVRKRYGKK